MQMAVSPSFRRESSQDCVSGEEKESSLAELDVLTADLFSIVVSSDTLFVTLFPTTVETLKDTSVLAKLTFYRFSDHVSLCVW